MVIGNIWGNVDNDKMQEKFDEVSPKFNEIREILTQLHTDLINKIPEKASSGSLDEFTEGIKFQLGGSNKRTIEDVNLMCLDVTHSYSKALVHFDNLNDLSPQSENYSSETYWFQYNAQVAIRQLGTLDDYLYRYINEFNEYNVENNNWFKNNVKKSLRDGSKAKVADALEVKDKMLEKYRNDITHNFNIFRNRVVTQETDDKGITAIGLSNATIPNNQKFIDDFEDMISSTNDKYKAVHSLNK